MAATASALERCARAAYPCCRSRPARSARISSERSAPLGLDPGGGRPAALLHQVRALLGARLDLVRVTRRDANRAAVGAEDRLRGGDLVLPRLPGAAVDAVAH